MFAAIAVLQSSADPDSLKQAMDALAEAFASGDVVMAIVAAVLIALIVVLKFLGKKVPFVDAGVGIVLSLAKRFVGGKVQAPGVKAVVEVKKDEDSKPAEGVGSVVSIKRDDDK